MATITQQPGSNGGKLSQLWAGIKSHGAIRRFLDWCYEALVIAAIPLTIVCTFIVAARLTSPEFFKSNPVGQGLGTLAENGLNAVVEASILGCIAMSARARRSGNEQQARRMQVIAWTFAALVVTTVGFWVFKASEQASQILLLVRCGASVVFCILSHAEDDDAGVLTPVQVASLEARIEEQAAQFRAQVAQQVAQFLATTREQSSQQVAHIQQSVSVQVASEVAKIQPEFGLLVAGEVAKILATVQVEVAQKMAMLRVEVAQEVASQVAQKMATVEVQVAQIPATEDPHVASQIGALMAMVSEQARTLQQFTNALADVRREVKTTVTEIRSYAPALPQPVAKTVESVAPEVAQNLATSDEPADRIRSFLATWSSQKKPTLQQIMEACQVAKKTATRYRDEFYGSQNDDDE